MSINQVAIVLGGKAFLLRELTAAKSGNAWFMFVPKGDKPNVKFGHRVIARGAELPTSVDFVVNGQVVNVPLEAVVDSLAKYPRVRGNVKCTVTSMDADKIFSVSISAPADGVWNLLLKVRGIAGKGGTTVRDMDEDEIALDLSSL